MIKCLSSKFSPMLPRNQATPFLVNFCPVGRAPWPGIPAPSWAHLLTGNHFQVYRVAEDVLLQSAPVFSTVIDCGFKRVVGPDLAPERAPIVEPLGRIVPRVVGPFALQCHTVFLEHLDPWGLKFHHSLREIR